VAGREINYLLHSNYSQCFIYTQIVGFNGYAFTDYEVIDPKAIWILLAIAGGILLIACINFTTLRYRPFGKPTQRSRRCEKVIGGWKTPDHFSIFWQKHYCFRWPPTIFGLVLAKLIIALVSTNYSGRDLHFFPVSLPANVFFIDWGECCSLGLPGQEATRALVLSGFQPGLTSSKNKIKIGGSKLLFTKSLVTFQFVLSIILIVSTVYHTTTNSISHQ